MKTHIKDISIMLDLLLTVKRYKDFGIKITILVKMIGISLSRYYEIKKKLSNQDSKPLIQKEKRDVSNPNKITMEEKKKIIEYALSHPNYFHRELAYRMIDENIVFVSMSTVYRTLKEVNLIKSYQSRKSYGWVRRYSNRASEPDELWQADITYLKYNSKDVYQLSFIDVYSRFVVLSVTLIDMTSNTVSKIFKNYIEKNISELRRIPTLQTDNGSCFIGYEFRKVIDSFKINHNKIHPGTPTENAIIERWNRTFKEILCELEEPESYENLIKITVEACYYYNYKRYHKSLNYVTPYTFYRGDPQVIFDERKIKIEEAKLQRKIANKRNSSLSIFKH